MAYNYQTLRLNNMTSVLLLEEQALIERVKDPMEREFTKWHARWRPESLEHYLPKGWCFGAFEEEQLVGYFLAQPMLFVAGFTQSLWLDHLFYTSLEVGQNLLDIAYRTAREKHFQKLFLSEADQHVEILQQFKSESFNDHVVEIKTAKF